MVTFASFHGLGQVYVAVIWYPSHTLWFLFWITYWNEFSIPFVEYQNKVACFHHCTKIFIPLCHPKLEPQGMRWIPINSYINMAKSVTGCKSQMLKPIQEFMEDQQNGWSWDEIISYFMPMINFASVSWREKVSGLQYFSSDERNSFFSIWFKDDLKNK